MSLQGFVFLFFGGVLEQAPLSFEPVLSARFFVVPASLFLFERQIPLCYIREKNKPRVVIWT